ncbi:MAG TPA: RtcB family protein [Candidatus Aphodousia faecalis]|nr:RtcB family protein [Candidatus Aphodousia faecalis]
MPIAQTLTENSRVPVKIWTHDIDLKSIDQLKNVASLPFVFHHVAAMPDVHAGMGATIGSVIATKEAVIPAAVGVDIGCGMLAARTNLTKHTFNERKLQRLMQEILFRVPVGFAQRSKENTRWKSCEPFEEPLKEILSHEPTMLDPMVKSEWHAQLGTLGGGNHFIELTADEEERLWIMLHSGSRGIGNIMASFFIARAKTLAKENGEELPDIYLASLKEGTEDFDWYMKAAHWSQDYAMANRQIILEDVLEALRVLKPSTELEGEIVNCHHNYVAQEEHFGETIWVTRKGAIRAGLGERGIIPGSMGACSYIVEGLGNEESFCSSSHGAGRKMSRTEAKKRFSVNELKAQTKGVVCRKDAGVLDEIPKAYKSIEAVMAQQSDLTKTIHELKQILCIKG